MQTKRKLMQKVLLSDDILKN